MATNRQPDNTFDGNSSSLNGKKVTELKKRILLAEGQKKAHIEEWEHQHKLNASAISDLKKEIKELTTKLTNLNNLDSRKNAKEPTEVYRKIPYPPGAKTADEAVHICDLQLIDLTKKLDLLNNKYSKQQLYLNNLLEKYNEFVAPKTENPDTIGPTPQTFEEDESKKLICHLENEIHRTNVQWMEAEHIRKKYNSIRSSLMTDAEKFEKSLLELEQALVEQEGEINRMQEIHKEAIQMRDATKIILLRQEHSANSSTKTRERQAFDFRRQVDERKMELERLERKLFSSGKTLLHQGSIESLTGEQNTGKTEGEPDPNAQAKETNNEMDNIFKKLMESSGATSPGEVLERFIAQKEATVRLGYLRTVTEGEKKHLEEEKDNLINQLETFKFADVKENEINQEQVEQLKNDTLEQQNKEMEYIQAAEYTQSVINSIKTTLIDLILKLQEIDETIDPIGDSFIRTSDIGKQKAKNDSFNLSNLLTGNVSNEQLLQILETKLRKGLKHSGHMETEMLLESETTNLLLKATTTTTADELNVPIFSTTPSTCPSPRPASTGDEKERPQPFPSCYGNLIAGQTRSTGQTSGASAGQISQPAVTDDEGEVPSRSYLKRQAMLIVDAKSRRKGFRAPIARRK